jgi:hypothetical protein
MSFETLKVNELRKVAEDFGVDLPEMLKNKQDLISHLVEEGVTWEVYQKTIKDVAEKSEDLAQEVLPKFDPKAEQPKDSVLVKMERANFRYDIMGFTFTKEHPFVAMNEKMAQEIFDKEEGFRLATPREVQEFYN